MAATTIQAMPDAAWNETARTYPDTLLHEAFAAQAAQHPELTAVRFRDEVLTYSELDRRVGDLARHLASLGVGRGSLVAVFMERSIELVVTLHAILRAGGAYVPIDPEFPDDRIAFMLGDLDRPLLLAQPQFTTRLADLPATIVPVGGPVVPPPHLDARALPQVLPDDVAYVIYTSGSTGRPKGAINTHRGIANRISWMQEYFGLTPSDRVLQKTPFTFDVSVWEFFWPLLFGAELVVAEPGGHRDTAYLSRTIIKHGITTVHFVPSMLQLFLEDPRAADCHSLRRVICSGEALPRALQDRFFVRLDAGLHNLYGPTEAAVDVSVWTCDPASELPFVPIGKPIANTQLHILDESMRPVPVGDVGELHIGGVQVGLGYLNRPDLTSERFVPDPFRPGGRLYKTGDLARHLPDGAIEFLGRSDFQVKIRGFRVELGEIEAALEAIDGVRGAVVVTRQRPSGDLELVAYVAHPDSDRLAVDDVRSVVGTRLPEYMVPGTVVVLDRLPLSPNGKVDRNALPAPARTRPALTTPFVAPRTELQRRIVAHWSEILGVERIGIHDRFFELGGTSLQAAEFVNRMQVDLNATIFVMTLFEAPSAEAYASLLERQFPSAAARWVGSSAPPGARGTSTADGRDAAGSRRLQRTQLAQRGRRTDRAPQ